MRTRVKEGQSVVRAVVEYFLTTTGIVPPIGPLTKHVDQLKEASDRLTAYGVEQGRSERAISALTRTALEKARTLRLEFMRPTAQLSKALFPTDAALRKSMEMPAATDYEGLVSAGLSMAARAEEHRELFVNAGFDPEFTERITKAATELKATVDAKRVEVGRRSAATAGMLEELARGRDIVRLLDAMVRPRLQNSPAKLAEWKSVSRFARVTKVKGETQVEVSAPGSGVVTETTARENAA